MWGSVWSGYFQVVSTVKTLVSKWQRPSFAVKASWWMIVNFTWWGMHNCFSILNNRMFRPEDLCQLVALVNNRQRPLIILWRRSLIIGTLSLIIYSWRRSTDRNVLYSSEVNAVLQAQQLASSLLEHVGSNVHGCLHPAPLNTERSPLLGLYTAMRSDCPPFPPHFSPFLDFHFLKI